MNLKTEMRRSGKAILDAEYVESIVEKAPLGVLSLCKDGVPYSIPMNFFYEDGTIYMHCAKEGVKIQYVKANPHACFLILHPVDVSDGDCHGGTAYESILCFGKTTFLERSPREILEKLGKKYGECTEITDEQCEKTALILIDVEEVSAKKGY